MPFGLFRRGTVQVPIPLTPDWRTDVQSEVTAYRSGNVVTVAAWRLAYAGSGTGAVLAYQLPPGYRPAGFMQDYAEDSRGKNVTLNYNGQVTITDPALIVAHHSFTFVTLDPMPAGGA